jgi:PAT family acetyl-CoA transporter-like MFS transporter 1
MSIKTVYVTIWDICKLKRTFSLCDGLAKQLILPDADVQSLIIMHIFAKVGFQANEAVTSLKMVEKGLGREDLAIAVLIDFPFQIFGGWMAARWSKGDKPLRPWILAFWPRLGFAFIATLIVYWFPAPPISMAFFTFVIIQTVLQSFSS